MGTPETAIDEAKLEQFMGQFVQDLGAGLTAPLVLIGDRLGLYKAMAGTASLSPAQLAERTRPARERYIREWLTPAGGRAAMSSTTPPRANSAAA